LIDNQTSHEKIDLQNKETWTVERRIVDELQPGFYYLFFAQCEESDDASISFKVCMLHDCFQGLVILI